MARVHLREVSKYFGQTAAVTNLSLDIAEGEFLTVLGGSGCGKSTTLHLIAGLESPSSGHILFDDDDVTALAPRERNVAVVFQSYALYPHKTVEENLAFPLRMAGAATADIRTRVREIARLLRVEELLARKPRQLSGGQQQRVALGRALIRRPRVFLLDEPLSNVDAQLRVALRQELQTLHQTIRTTLVYVTHDQEEAMVLSDRVAVMQAGKIVQCAPPRDIYTAPANLAVAELVGSPPINLLDVEVRDRAFVLPGGTHIPIPATRAAWLSQLPPRFRLGIRPEHLLLSEEPGLARAAVRRVEYLGKEIHVALDGSGYALTVRTDARHRVREGETVSWSWDWEHLRCFDPHHGTSLMPAPRSHDP